MFLKQKKTFITRQDATWKNMSQTEKELFMKSPPPAPSKNRIGLFFQSKSASGKQPNKSSQLAALEPSETIQLPSKPRLGQTLNANEALFNREAFLRLV